MQLLLIPEVPRCEGACMQRELLLHAGRRRSKRGSRAAAARAGVCSAALCVLPVGCCPV
jgi:hypothetical protein